MKRTIILLNAFFISLILLQGCNNIEKQEKNIYIFSPDLSDKYWYKKSAYLHTKQYDSTFNIGTYGGFLILGKIFNEKYNDFINRDIYAFCQCGLFNDGLYIEITNDFPRLRPVPVPKSIYLKIEKNKYEIIVIERNDGSPP